MRRVPRVDFRANYTQTFLFVSEGVAVQGHSECRERNQLHVQHAAAHGRGGLEYRKLGEAEGGLPAPDTSRWSDEYTKSTGEDAAGPRVARKERGHQEGILQESVIMIKDTEMSSMMGT